MVARISAKGGKGEEGEECEEGEEGEEGEESEECEEGGEGEKGEGARRARRAILTPHQPGRCTVDDSSPCPPHSFCTPSKQQPRLSKC